MQPQNVKGKAWRRRKRALKRIYRIPLEIWCHSGNEGRRIGALCEAVHWQVLKRLFQRPRVVVLTGATILKAYPDSSSASKVIYFNGLYDYDEMMFITRYLRTNDSVLDCGANIGVYSLLAATVIGPGGTVIAIEPLPKNAARIRENAALNGFHNITVYELALADREGVSSLTTGMDVSNRVEPQTYSELGSIPVHTTPLEAIVKTNERFMFGKLDVEGSECAALRGAYRLLLEKNPPVWQFEIIDHLLMKQGSSRAELIELFTKNGFRIAVYHSRENQLRWTEGDCKTRNMYAVAESHVEEVVGRLEGTGLDDTLNSSFSDKPI